LGLTKRLIDDCLQMPRCNDFNDLIIADTVNERELKLLSDDGDFKILWDRY